jgi:hypothetical protein
MPNEDDTVQDVLQQVRAQHQLHFACFNYPRMLSIVNIEKLVQLQSSGKQAQLEAMLKQRLENSEWIDNLKARCKAFLQQRGADNVTIEEVIHKIAPEGRSTVPGSVKAEILAELKTFVQEACARS